MKFLIDMNLSPGWIDVLTAEGWEAVHWSTVGAHRATDESIMTWAREHAYVVVTHDLDFSALLAATRAVGRSQCHPGAHTGCAARGASKRAHQCDQAIPASTGRGGADIYRSPARQSARFTVRIDRGL